MLPANLLLLFFGEDAVVGLLILVFIILPLVIAGVIFLAYLIMSPTRAEIEAKKAAQAKQISENVQTPSEKPS